MTSHQFDAWQENNVGVEDNTEAVAVRVNRVRRPLKPCSKPIRRAKIVGGKGRYVMLLTVGMMQTGYYVESIPADFGIGFKVEKFACDGGGVYDVNLDPATRNHTCTCLGNTYHDHCKHVEALQALRNAGKL